MNWEKEKQIIERSGVDQSDILSKKNVQSFYPGTKVSNGVDTKEECIVVGVVKKVDKESLSKEDLVPEELEGGIKTDIIEEFDIQRYGFCGSSNYIGDRQTPYGPCEGHVFDQSGEVFKNIPGGISMGPSVESQNWTGTLGIIVRDKTDGALVALSNNHVLGDYLDLDYEILGCYANDDSGFYAVDQNLSPLIDKVIQIPSQSDSGGKSITLGSVKRSVPTKWGKGLFSLPFNNVDAGIVSINSDLQASTSLQGLLPGPFKVGDAKNGRRVVKSGRTTGVTGLSAVDSPAKIVSTNYTVAVSSGCEDNLYAKFTDCIKFNWNPQRKNSWEWFSYAGDSGAAVIMDDDGSNRLIGLLFAGTYFPQDSTVPSPPYGTGVACKIGNVFDALNVEAWDGRIVCPSQSKFVKIDGQCYENTNFEKSLSEVTHRSFTETQDPGDCI